MKRPEQLQICKDLHRIGNFSSLPLRIKIGMPIMKAIIHIGMMKTGSSTIQKWLRRNRLALAAEGMHSNKGMGMHRRALQHATGKASAKITVP